MSSTGIINPIFLKGENYRNVFMAKAAGMMIAHIQFNFQREFLEGGAI
jgi:hypothetical protein